jgi:hypothetical protein
MYFEIDVCAYESDERSTPKTPPGRSDAGVATVAWAPPQPTLALDADLAEQYEYETLVYSTSSPVEVAKSTRWALQIRDAQHRKVIMELELAARGNRERGPFDVVGERSGACARKQTTTASPCWSRTSRPGGTPPRRHARCTSPVAGRMTA